MDEEVEKLTGSKKIQTRDVHFQTPDIYSLDQSHFQTVTISSRFTFSNDRSISFRHTPYLLILKKYFAEDILMTLK